MDISSIRAVDLQDDIIAPIFIEEYKKQVTKRIEDGGYMNILGGCIRSVFQDFESYLRTEVDLVEDDIKLVLDKHNTSFITYELEPGIYSYREISEALFNILQLEYPSSDSENLIRPDDITRKTKMVVNSGIIAIRFHEKSFLVLSLVLLLVGIISSKIKSIP